MSEVEEATTGRADAPWSARWIRSILQNISDTVSIADASGVLTFTSGIGNQILGYDDPWWDRRSPMELVHPDDRDRAMEAWARSAANPRVEIHEEVRMRAADGTWQDIAVSGVNLLDDPAVRGFLMTTRNITPLRRAERLASHQAAVLERIARGEPIEAVADACVELLADNGASGAPAVFRLEGQRLLLAAGAAPPDLVDWLAEGVRRPDRSVCDAAMAARGPVVLAEVARAELDPQVKAIAAATGAVALWSQPILSSATGEPLGSICTAYDQRRIPTPHERRVTDTAANLLALALERVEHEERLAHQALHDPLTGLPNRSLLLDRLDHALARDEGVAVLFLDIDRFKLVNDSLGHTAGDQLLVALATRVCDAVGPSHTVARIGGDELVVLLEGIADEPAARALASRIVDALAPPFSLGGSEVEATVSMGLAVATDRQPAEAWLRDADAAMYRAKELGRNRLVLFDTEMREAVRARLQVEHDLRRAVERDQLEVHYQPVVDLRAGRIVGAEALVRWRHPTRGLLAPDDFIEIAEEVGTIAELGRHVLDAAVGAVAEVVAPPEGQPFQLGINVSARQLTAGDLVGAVRACLARHRWPADSLLLEITESALVGSATDALAQLADLRALGIQLAIDDFGTGWSSLERLGRLPVDQVKIDRTFVAALDEPDDRMGRMVDAVLGIAGALDHRSCAEGVETQAQLDALRRKRCDYAQGYLFARPMPLEEFASLYAADPRW